MIRRVAAASSLFATHGPPIISVSLGGRTNEKACARARARARDLLSSGNGRTKRGTTTRRDHGAQLPRNSDEGRKRLSSMYWPVMFAEFV